MGATNIVSSEVEAYLGALMPKRHPRLLEMEKIAAQRNFPIVGPLVGQLLGVLVSVSGARRILELGSGFGYSAAWMAEAVGVGGSVCMTEHSSENVDEARKHLEAMGLADRVSLNACNALDALASMDGPFDLIFNDVDKEQYPEVFEQAIPRLRIGGLLVSDNVLWKGRVADAAADDADTRGIRRYNTLMFATPGVRSSIVPLRDGVGISIRER
jgi:predicted O-methyltransferase YrrM